jgi:hypothetical protein
MEEMIEGGGKYYLEPWIQYMNVIDAWPSNIRS